MDNLLDETDQIFENIGSFNHLNDSDYFLDSLFKDDYLTNNSDQYGNYENLNQINESNFLNELNCSFNYNRQINEYHTNFSQPQTIEHYTNLTNQQQTNEIDYTSQYLKNDQLLIKLDDTKFDPNDKGLKEEFKNLDVQTLKNLFYSQNDDNFIESYLLNCDLDSSFCLDNDEFSLDKDLLNSNPDNFLNQNISNFNLDKDYFNFNKNDSILSGVANLEQALLYQNDSKEPNQTIENLDLKQNFDQKSESKFETKTIFDLDNFVKKEFIEKIEKKDWPDYQIAKSSDSDNLVTNNYIGKKSTNSMANSLMKNNLMTTNLVENQLNKNLLTNLNLNKNLASQSEKIIKCSICLYSSADKSKLKRHYLTHSRQKPFGCQLCGSKFTQSGSLKTHLAHIHNVDQIEFTCSVCCTFRSSSIGELNKHQKVEHNKKSENDKLKQEQGNVINHLENKENMEMNYQINTELNYQINDGRNFQNQAIYETNYPINNQINGYLINNPFINHQITNYQMANQHFDFINQINTQNNYFVKNQINQMSNRANQANKDLIASYSITNNDLSNLFDFMY